MSAKVPPHSIEAEASVLGGLMYDGSAIADVGDLIAPEDFYRADHRAIFEAIRSCDEAGKAFDALSLAETLERKGTLDDIGMDYLNRLVTSCPGIANIRSYAEIVRDRAVRRRLIAAGNNIAQAASATGQTTAEVLEQSQAQVLEVERPTGKGPRHILAGFTDWADDLDRRMEAGGSLVGLSTGLTDLDRQTLGMEAGDLWILAARPSMGKTSLAMNILEHVAGQGNPVLFFSLEMPERQLLTRSIASLGRLDSERLRMGTLEADEWARVTTATTRMKDLPLYIDDQSGLSITDMRARARRIRRNGLKLICVDYLQLMKSEGENQNVAVGNISKGLKSLAKDIGVPVLALSQLNRGVEQRQNKRPGMADLRDSGSIEQDADIIAFLYRDIQYNDNCPFPHVAELDIAKQRNGATGTTYLNFNGPQMRFGNLDHQDRQDYINWERNKNVTPIKRGFEG